MMENFFQLEQLKILADRVFSSGLKIVLILILAFILDRLGRRIIIGLIRRISRLKDHLVQIDRKRERSLARIFFAALSTTIWAVALLMILSEFSIDIQALLAGVGIMGLAIGMGARRLIEDYIAGIFIVLEDHYRVGEEIEITGVKGEVIDLNLRRTILKDAEGKIYFIPNGQINKVANFSRGR